MKNVLFCLDGITMTNQEILDDFLSLPAEAQNQVVSLIIFLKQKYISSQPLPKSSSVDLASAPFAKNGKTKLRQDWAGMLKADGYTSVELQHLSVEWRNG
ncbi:DUF2281 domain-containing protein [Arthrospira platensis FACHB-971]|uniref:DUF2281 domain-containing protein n=2 Tax=Sirenicapillariaceae TaxID=2934961 RepID=A0A5M3T8G8_LIMPL|nr:hypothetical protein AP285_17420 [Arthrospira platensis YZ]KDR55494.1 hypothetical protein APPUASWS_021885 [Arthrospira platensis str. Paraca]MBD2575571.1 DUF2281 domain-containing protein [Arthrospira platensis FACHB-971]MBD2671797.1 DUF2281 domain-containing protein [Arthrospira platensis FACHB-439]MBD2712742.1 DUF2281 domain-containing protein [Arthrospira platensis FACHB-835]BAI91772.1 hypothetical protein NIES39_K01230 [Arthrospira platensis NIES-39]GCE95973.1 hypothetical protein NIE